MSRVLAIGLDGYDDQIFSAMVDSGELPAMAKLRQNSAVVPLDHGAAQRSGLGWEQISTGLAPEASGRHTAVNFDCTRYSVTHESARYQPFVAGLGAKTVVFDAPYFDLRRAPGTQGLVCWGGHDPGVPPMSEPPGLFAEAESQFGRYVAPDWTYGFAWPSAERAQTMGRELVKAVEQRAEVALWLLDKRLPDWDMALLVIGELHGAYEALWHGVDPSHPLHDIASAKPSGDALRALLVAVDKMVGRLCAAFPDALVVCFATHGMGANNSDVPSMVLLPELLYRAETGRRLLKEAPAGDGVPMLEPDQAWQPDLAQPLAYRCKEVIRGIAKSALSPTLIRMVARSRESMAQARDAVAGRPLQWHVSTRYMPFWPKMRVFGLPSFYDGRVRINLKGREASGLVEPDEYEAEIASVCELVRSCIDPATGQTIVADVERPEGRGPDGLDPTEADVTFTWNGSPLAFSHKELGTVGPLPYRRTGGHTGGHGFAYVCGPGVETGLYGTREVFDLVPTIIDLLGKPVPERLSGTSFASMIGARSQHPAETLTV